MTLLAFPVPDSTPDPAAVARRETLAAARAHLNRMVERWGEDSLEVQIAENAVSRAYRAITRGEL